MINIYKNLYVGNQDELSEVPQEWLIIHASKASFLRIETNPLKERYVAVRQNEVYLNLIDARDPIYISKEAIDFAVEYIHKYIDSKNIFLHCVAGLSRSPSIALLYLMKNTNVFQGLENFEEVVEKFVEFYPLYSPGLGMQIVTRYYYTK